MPSVVATLFIHEPAVAAPEWFDGAGLLSRKLPVLAQRTAQSQRHMPQVRWGCLHIENAMATKPAKRAAPVKTGRPSKFTQEIAEAICGRIACGESLRKVCERTGMPSLATVMRWLADPARAQFREQYVCAREAQADKLVEDLLEIADEECTMVKADKHGSSDDDGCGRTEVVFDAVAVARNKLRVDARKWIAARMAPKKYGDRITQEHTGRDGGPIETVTRVTRTIIDPKKA